MHSFICRHLWIMLSVAAPLSLTAGGVFRGTVSDNSGAVVAGASIQVVCADRTVSETQTNSRGEFRVEAPSCPQSNDIYSIVAAGIGFAPISRLVRASDSGAERIDLVLDVAPYRQAIEVHAALPLNESLMDMSGVRESAAKDLAEALTTLDGVWKIRKAGIANDLVIRGFQQNNINVLVDGSRTFGACPNHMDPPTQHVDFAEVERVEVTKGAIRRDEPGQPGRRG